MTPPDDNDFGSRLRDRKDESYALETGGARRKSLRQAAEKDSRLYEKMSGGVGPDGYSLRKRLGSRRVALVIGVTGVCLLVLTLVILSFVLGGRTAAPATANKEQVAGLNAASPRLFAIEFLKTANIDEKAALCRYPDEARSQIAQFYGQGPTLDDYFDVRGLGVKMESGVSAYHFHVVFNDRRNRLLPVLSRGDGSYAVDWECFARRGSLSWDKFLGTSADQEGVFRAYLRPGNYYNFDFEDRNQHVCFVIDSPDLEQRIFAYADRGSVLARTIRKTFGTERGARLMVKLATTPDSAKNRQVRILKLVAASWIAPDR